MILTEEEKELLREIEDDLLCIVCKKLVTECVALKCPHCACRLVKQTPFISSVTEEAYCHHYLIFIMQEMLRPATWILSRMLRSHKKSIK